VVVAVNKWDDVDNYTRDMTSAPLRASSSFSRLRDSLHFGREGRGLAKLMDSAEAAYRAAMASYRRRDSPAPDRRRGEAIPPAPGSRPKLRYAHQGGSNPPPSWCTGTDPST